MALNFVAPCKSGLQRCVIDREYYVSLNMSQLTIGNGAAHRVTPCACMSAGSCQLDANPISPDSCSRISRPFSSEIFTPLSWSRFTTRSDRRVMSTDRSGDGDERCHRLTKQRSCAVRSPALNNATMMNRHLRCSARIERVTLHRCAAVACRRLQSASRIHVPAGP